MVLKLLHRQQFSSVFVVSAGAVKKSAGERRRAIPRKFSCENCGKPYVSKRTAWYHRKYECGKEPQFQCPYCHHKSKIKGNMRRHIGIRHPEHYLSYIEKNKWRYLSVNFSLSFWHWVIENYVKVFEVSKLMILRRFEFCKHMWQVIVVLKVMSINMASLKRRPILSTACVRILFYQICRNHDKYVEIMTYLFETCLFNTHRVFVAR